MVHSFLEQGRRKITTAMRVLEASNRRNLLRTLNKGSTSLKPTYTSWLLLHQTIFSLLHVIMYIADSGKKQTRLSPLSSSPDQGYRMKVHHVYLPLLHFHFLHPYVKFFYVQTSFWHSNYCKDTNSSNGYHCYSTNNYYIKTIVHVYTRYYYIWYFFKTNEQFILEYIVLSNFPYKVYWPESHIIF
jgi:hypothetical protein